MFAKVAENKNNFIMLHGHKTFSLLSTLQHKMFHRVKGRVPVSRWSEHQEAELTTIHIFVSSNQQVEIEYYVTIFTTFLYGLICYFNS